MKQASGWRRAGRYWLGAVRERLAAEAVQPHDRTADGDGGQPGRYPARRQPGGLERVVGDCAVYEEGLRCGPRLPVTQAAARARQTKGFVWIGLQHPSQEDLNEVAAEFGLPELAVEDAVLAHQRPKLEVYDGVLFAVLRPVRYVDSDEIVEVEEIALFVGAHFVVSVRHGDTQVLARVRRELDAGTLPTDVAGPTAVLHRAADLIVDQYAEVVEAIDDDVAQIEAEVFGEDEDDRSERIYKLKREVLEFRRAVLPLVDPMARLAGGQVPGVDPRARHNFRDVHDHVLRTADEIERHDRLLSDILQANVARVSMNQNRTAVRQNEDMRRISAWAAIALVPTAVAGIYGMNFDNMPELGWRYGYFYALGVIGTACVILYTLFRRNGWL